ncbi:MAG TPA: hypothetical protein VNI83_02155 [Vicinamibacterales bacterium]|nr:hypothetical protein [Vicinamibacterales bacterium]
MTGQWWTYEPATRYRRRQAQQWTAQARRYAFNVLASREAEGRGFDPEVLALQPTVFDRPQITGRDIDAVRGPRKEEKGGGLLGSIGEALDDATSAVFGGEVRQPWDVLRPIKRLMDAEQRYIARPLASAVYEGVTGDEYEDAPGLVKFGLEALASPSTYIGPGAVKAVARGATAQKAAVRLGTAALDTDSKLLGAAARAAAKVTGAPAAIAGGAGQAQFPQIADQALRRLLGGELPAAPMLTAQDKLLNTLKRTIGFGVEEDALATTVMRHRADLKRTADHLANRLAAVTGRRVRQAFKFDEAGRITSIPGAPTIQDLAARLPQFDQYLDDAQRSVLRELRDEMQFYRDALAEQGIEIGSRPDVMEGGFYLPRGNALEEGADAPIKVFAGGGRAGARKGFEKTAVFGSMVEGIEQGFKYAPFEDAIRGYARDAANRAIDAYTANVLKNATDEAGELIAKSPGDRLEEIAPGLKARAEGLRNKISGRLQTLVRQSTRGMSENAATARLKRLLDDTERRVARAEAKLEPGTGLYTGTREAEKALARAEAELLTLDREANRLAGATQRAAERGMRTEERYLRTLEEVETLRDELNGIKGEWQRALDRARQTPRNEGQIGIAQLSGYSFPLEVANAANAYLRAEQRGESGLRALNNLMRGLRATGDLSFLGIQGLLGLAHEPGSYGRAWKAAIRGLADEDALAKFIEDFDARAAAAGLPDSKAWIKAGLRLGGKTVPEEFGVTAKGFLRAGGKVERLPGVKQSNRAFGFFGDALRLDAASAMRMANPNASLEQLAQAANLMSGWTKGRFLGDVGEWVQFAPRFFQSQLELVARALTDGGATGQQARWMLGKLLGFGTLMTVTANEALGNVTEFDPRSPNFLRIRAAGQDVSLFGPWDSLVKAIVNGAKGDFEYLARTKASPLVATTWDAIAGRTFTGDPVLSPLKPGEADPEKVANFLKSFLPFGIQDAIREGIGPGIPIGFTGVKSAPLTKADLVDEAAREAFGESWEDLSAQEVLALAEKFPDRIDAKTARQAVSVKKALEPYYAIEQQVWDRINDRPEFSAYETLDEYIEAKAEELRRMGVPEGEIARRLEALPVISLLNSSVRKLRQRYRLAHPEVDAILVSWYGATPIREQIGARRTPAATR